MKIKMKILLLDLNIDSHVGSAYGQQVFAKLEKLIETNSKICVFNISFSGIEQTDASFLIRSIFNLVKQYQGTKFFYISDLENRDIELNFQCVALYLEMHITHLTKDSKVKWLGEKLTAEKTELLNYICHSSEVTANSIAKKFSISLPNASMKLKKLFQTGFIIGNKRDALTGGIEFIYKPIIQK